MYFLLQAVEQPFSTSTFEDCGKNKHKSKLEITTSQKHTYFIFYRKVCLDIVALSWPCYIGGQSILYVIIVMVDRVLFRRCDGVALKS